MLLPKVTFHNIVAKSSNFLSFDFKAISNPTVLFASTDRQVCQTTILLKYLLLNYLGAFCTFYPGNTDEYRYPHFKQVQEFSLNDLVSVSILTQSNHYHAFMHKSVYEVIGFSN